DLVLRPLAVFASISLRMPTKKKVARKVSRRGFQAVAKKKKMPRYVYNFAGGKADGDGSMKPLLGGKGANLAEMTRIGLPVPPGFTITTEVCSYYYQNRRTYPKQLELQVRSGVEFLEKTLGKEF